VTKSRAFPDDKNHKNGQGVFGVKKCCAVLLSVWSSSVGKRVAHNLTMAAGGDSSPRFIRIEPSSGNDTGWGISLIGV